jgi:hypothetical protein
MSETQHVQNLARIQNHINGLEPRILELQARMHRQAAKGFNAETSRALLVVLIENLEIMKIRQRQEQDAIQASRIIGPTGCQNEVGKDLSAGSGFCSKQN